MHLALALLLSACASGAPIRLTTRESIAVVFHGPETLEPETIDALTEELLARNLAPKFVATPTAASSARSGPQLSTTLGADFTLHAHGAERPDGVSLNLTLTARDVPDLLAKRRAILAADAVLSATSPLVDLVTSLVDSALFALPSHGFAILHENRDGLYFAMIDRFARPLETAVTDPPIPDPDGWHGGTFDGLRARLDWLVDLGVGDLWVSPPFDTRDTSFLGHPPWHGYWTTDLGSVEPRFGTESDLVALADATRARGLGFWLDLVLNHVGPDAPLATAHPDWFHVPRPIRDWSDPADLTTGQVHGLPDFKQDHPEVDAYLRESTDHWLDVLAPRGLRLDAVRHIGPDFWRRFNGRLLRTHPGLGRLAEILDGDPLVVEKTAREGAFGAIFDFALHYALRDAFCGAAGAGPLGSALSVNLALDAMARARGEAPLTRYAFLDNHDLPRIASLCDGDLARVGAALDALVALPARPSINWGTEVGLMGATEPDNRAPMRFDPAHPLVARTRAALAWRAAIPELREGHTRIEAFGGGALVISRFEAPLGRATLVAINPTATPATLALPPHWPLQALEAPALAVTSWRTQRLSPPPEELVPVTFQVEGAPADDVRLAGADPMLGGWSPDRAPRLADTTLALAPGRLYAMKLVARPPGGAPLWESRANRYLFVPGPGPMHVTLIWNGE